MINAVVAVNPQQMAEAQSKTINWMAILSLAYPWLNMGLRP